MPDFKHSIVHELYRYGFDIDDSILNQILALGDAVIPDLDLAIEEAINNYDTYGDFTWETHSFPVHAVCLLNALEAKQSVPVVLRLIKLEADIVYYWFGAGFILTDSIGMFLAFHAVEYTEELKALIRKDHFDAPALKTVLIGSLSLIARSSAEHLADTIAFYHELLDQYLAPERPVQASIISLIPKEQKEEWEEIEEEEEIIGYYISAMLEVGEALKGSGILEKMRQLIRAGLAAGDIVDEDYLQMLIPSSPITPYPIDVQYQRLLGYVEEGDGMGLFGKGKDEDEDEDDGGINLLDENNLNLFVEKLILGGLREEDEFVDEDEYLPYIPELRYQDELDWVYRLPMPESPEIAQTVFDIGESLIPDLELIITDYLDHPDQYQIDSLNTERTSFIKHAFLYLQQFESYDSFPLLLRCLRIQSPDFMVWMGDFFYGQIYPFIATCGRRYQKEIKACLFDPMVSNSAKLDIAYGIHEMGLKYPDTFAWVKKQLGGLIIDTVRRELLESFYTQDDFPHIALIKPLVEFIHPYYKYELPKSLQKPLEELHENRKVSPEELSELLNPSNPISNEPNIFPKDITEAYALFFENRLNDVAEALAILEEFGDEFEGEFGEGFEGKESYIPPERIISDGFSSYQREQPKVGRNDPCPCGSGKKYKKCHGQA